MNTFAAKALAAAQSTIGKRAIRLTAALAAAAVAAATVGPLVGATSALLDSGPIDTTVLLATSLKTLVHVPLQAQAFSHSVLTFFGFL